MFPNVVLVKIYCSLNFFPSRSTLSNLFINGQQLALIPRTNTTVQDARLAAETNSKTGVQTKLNSNHENKSSIQNASDLFIIEQQHVPISRHHHIVQASQLTSATSSTTGLLTFFNDNHESNSSIHTTPDLFRKEQHHAPLSQNNNIVQASRLTVEKLRKNDVHAQLNSNHESESLIQNAPDFLTNEQHLSPLSRHHTIDQDPRLAAATTRNTVLLHPFNGNHESKSLIQNAPDICINE